jgi:egghead protein (zeste-white 4 protein)
MQAGAERKISFDNGPDGSVAEDCFFGMKAYAQGYSFNFIEGEMWEKSPFTMWDFLQQRKRWMQVINNKKFLELVLVRCKNSMKLNF